MTGDAAPRGRWLVVIAALVALAWLPSVHDGHVTYDSDWMVVNNPILGTGSLAALPTVFWDLSGPTRETMGAEYLPIRDLTVLLDFAVWGRWWAGHHLSNVLWYALSCGLFFAVLVRLFPPRSPGALPARALAGALAFGLHPIHAEPAAWLAGRKESVALTLALAAMLAWLRRREITYGSVVALVLYAMACLSKGNVIVLPALLVLLSLLHEHPRDRWSETLKAPHWWAQWIPWAGVCAALIALAAHVGDQVAFYTEPRATGLLDKVILQGHLFGHYLGSLLAPVRLAALYPEPGPIPLMSVHGALSAAVLLLGAGAIGWGALRRPRLALGLAWFAIALAPTSAFMPLQTLMADRYALLASGGVVIAALSLIPERVDARRLALGAAPVLLLLAGLTVRQALAWRSTVDLWAHQVAQRPSVEKGWSNLAGALQAAGQPEEAAAVVASGIGRFGAQPTLLQTRGWLELERGDVEAAAQTLEEAWRAQPSLRRAGNNLAVARGRLGDLDGAVEAATEVVTAHPRYADGWNTLGALHIDQQDGDAAAAALDRALTLDPWAASATTNRGNAAWLQGDRPGARAYWTRALRLDPNQEGARRGLEHLDRTGG